MIWKYVCAILFVACLIFAGILAYRDSVHRHAMHAIQNELARTKEQVQETATAFSKAAIELEGIKTENEELQTIIDNRDEKILALTELNLKLKERKVQINNATEATVDSSGAPAQPVTCAGREDLRSKVSFAKMEDGLQVSGFTLTNPPYAELKFEWVEPLKLELVLTRDDNGNFRVYVDSANASVVPTNIDLKVDPNVFKQKWYENFGVSAGTSIARDYNIAIMSKIFYAFNLSKSLQISPYAELKFSVKLLTLQPNFGVSLSYFPFRR